MPLRMAIDPSPSLPAFRRPVFDVVLTRLGERRRFIQVLAGPRQVGKTTLAQQVLVAVALPWHYGIFIPQSLDDTRHRSSLIRRWLASCRMPEIPRRSLTT